MYSYRCKMWLGFFLLSALAFLMLLSGCATVPQGEDWPMYMHDGGRSGYTSDTISDSPKLVWVMEYSSQTSRRELFVTGNKIYLGHEGFDIATGKLKWKTMLGSEVIAAKDNMIYVADELGLHAIGAGTGKEKWKSAAMEGHYYRLWALEKDVLIFGQRDWEGDWPRDKLVALDTGTGQRVWETDLPSFDGYILYNNGVAYLNPLEECAATELGCPIAAIDARSGQVRWKFPQEGANIEPRAAVEGTLYVFDAQSLKVYAVDVAAGQKRWEFSAAGGGVVADTETAYLTGTYGEDVIYALDAASGQEKWRFMSPIGRLNSMLLAGDRLVVAAERGGGYPSIVYLLDVETGEKKWTEEVEGFFGSMIVAKGRLFVVSDFLYCFK